METDSKLEFLRLMTYLAEHDRETYRALRSEAWAAVAKKHATKTPGQIAEWMSKAS